MTDERDSDDEAAKAERRRKAKDAAAGLIALCEELAARGVRVTAEEIREWINEGRQ